MALLNTRQHKTTTYSSVGIGTWAIGGPYWTDGEPTGWGGPLDDSDSVRGLRMAIDAGLTHIDTADVYGLGKSERLVAEAIAGQRDRVTIASKVGFVATSAESSYSSENIRFQCEQSLRNLKVDYLDIYYLHHCDLGPDDKFLRPAIEQLTQLKSEGLIRSIGLSGYSAADLIRVGSQLRPDVIQSWASFEHPEFVAPDGELTKYMEGSGIRFVAMMPLGQGRLLGKYGKPTAEQTFEPGDNRATNPEFNMDSLASFDSKLRLVRDRFGDTARDLLLPALGYVLAHPVVISVVPGFRNSKQVRDLVSSMHKEYSKDDHEFMQTQFPYAGGESTHPWAE
ncbi:MAG: aldo/keto reductase [Nocardioides sp.]